MHGQVEKNLAMQAYRNNEPLPDFIANAPELEEGLFFYLQAFFDLDSERTSGMNRGQIPFFKIIKYAKHYKLDDDEESVLVHHIRLMDNAHLKRLADKDAEEQKRNEAKTKRGKNTK